MLVFPSENSLFSPFCSLNSQPQMPDFSNGTMIIFTDDNKGLGAKDLADPSFEVLQEIGHLGYYPIAVDLPDFGSAPPFSESNNAEIKLPYLFISNLFIMLGVEKQTSTLIFTGKTARYLMPFILNHDDFCRAVLAIDIKYDQDKLSDNSKFQDLQLKYSKIQTPFWIFWTDEMENLEKNKVLFLSLKNGKQFTAEPSDAHIRKPLGARHAWVFEDIDKFIDMITKFSNYLYAQHII